MATGDTITRRSRGTRLSSEDKDGTSTVVDSTRIDEKEPSSDGSRKSYGPKGRQRRRQMETKLDFLMRTLQRRWMLHVRQKPWLSQGVFVYASLAVFVALVGLFLASSFRTKKKGEGMVLPPLQLSTNFGIVFYQHATSSTELYEPEELDSSDEGERSYSDYGDLKIDFFQETGASRNIILDYSFSETDWRDYDDDVDGYYAFDDDYLRSQKVADSFYEEVQNEDEGNEELQNEDEGNGRCRRVSEHTLNFPSCNVVHELPLLEYSVKYLSTGGYRQVMVVDHDFRDDSEKIVVKELRYDFEGTYGNYEYVRMDAIVAERLTASPRIFDIYGMCGYTVLSEFFPHGDMNDILIGEEGYAQQEDLDDEHDVNPQNNLTAIEKVTIALHMAEAIADLHSYPGGVMIHGDIDPKQFLYSTDKTLIKLNDFNRAEWMLWDDEKQDYCRYSNGGGYGNWRAPEECDGKLLNEQVDVWSLGNNMYALLTGMGPFYDNMEDDVIQERLIGGETAYIDPRYRTRSVAERTLAEVIDRCFLFDPDDRADIFEVVDKLREGLQETLQEEESMNGVQESRKVREKYRIGRLGRIGKALRSASLTADDKLP